MTEPIRKVREINKAGGIDGNKKRDIHESGLSAGSAHLPH